MSGKRIAATHQTRRPPRAPVASDATAITALVVLLVGARLPSNQAMPKEAPQASNLRATPAQRNNQSGGRQSGFMVPEYQAQARGSSRADSSTGTRHRVRNSFWVRFRARGPAFFAVLPR